jgi:hypothetical protein
MPVGDTSSLDVANEIAKRQHDYLAAGAQQPQAGTAAQQLSAVFTGEGGLTADATLAATATVTWPPGYEEMLRRLSELEATMAQLPALLPPAPGIGHNNPPPLDHAELEEIKRDMALLKAQPPPAPADANKIANKWVQFGQRVSTWVGKQVDTFITEMMKTGGKAAGPVIVGSSLWLTLGQQLQDSAASIMHWLLTQLGQ